MWESPVNVIYGEMQAQIEGEIYKAIRNVGIDVDKEELIKALMYDREQYEKGYSDGYAKAIDEFVELFIKKDSKHIMDYNYYETLREVAEEMKGGANNA